MIKKTVTLIHKKTIVIEAISNHEAEKQARQAAYDEKADEYEIDSYYEETDNKFPIIRKYQNNG